MLQECKFQVGCYIHDATQIWFNGTFGHDTVNQRAQQYEINIVPLDEVDRTVVWANRDYSQTGFKVRFFKINSFKLNYDIAILIADKASKASNPCFATNVPPQWTLCCSLLDLLHRPTRNRSR